MLRNRISTVRTLACVATLIVLAVWIQAAPAFAQVAAAAPAAPVERGQLSLGMVFTCFMVMLGPIKLVAPFAALTSEMEDKAARGLAMKAVGIACIGGLVAAVVGQNTLVSWGVSLTALHFAGGLILLVVALKNVLAQYEAPGKAAEPAVAPRNPAFSPLAFPTILTPYGLAVFMLLLAMTADREREIVICLLFLAVMALNLLVMWFARAIMRRGSGALAILGAVLGVLQVALALQMILSELRVLRLMPALHGPAL